MPCDNKKNTRLIMADKGFFFSDVKREGTNIHCENPHLGRTYLPIGNTGL